MNPADSAVRELITTSGLDRTLFVEAGAGTGKTTQLVGRIVNLVLHDRIPLAQIAAITFTEAAAAELQARIRVAFEKIAADTDDDKVRDACRVAIADADLAAISTLHGFAKRILGEHPVAAGLPPRIDILDEVSSTLAREARWERFVDALYDDPANETLLVRAALLDATLEPRYPGHATMKDVAVELGQSWDGLDPVADAVHGPLPIIDFGSFDRAVDDVAALLDLCTDEDDKLYCHLVETLLPAMQAVAGPTDPDRKLRALKQVKEWGVGGGGKAAAWSGDVAAAKDRIRAVNAARDAVLGTATDDVLARLLTLVCREVRDAAEARRADGHLEFHDLLVLARRLLRSSPTARDALHERYSRLLLDEFQDTDPIQIELAVLIAAAVQGVDPPAWNDVPVEDGRLFFVGDPKQSIYRFRRADIELFLRARDRFGIDGNLLQLVTNFRTVPEVLRWINEVFGRLMETEVSGRQPRYEGLASNRESSPDGDHRPVLLGHPHDSASAAELRQAEAGDVARTVADIRAAPETWPVYDGGSLEWRPAELTDITILIPTRTSLPFLREALGEHEIPYRLDTGTLVYETQEIRDALAALRAIDDVTDQLGLVSALRSPMYACSDADLFTYRHAGGRFDLRRDPPDELPPDHPVTLALTHLRSLWDVRWWSGPSELLTRLLDERRAFVLAFAEDRPKEVWGRLRFLIDQARAFEEAGGGGLRAFLEWAELQRSESARVHEPRLPETDDRAVRIMTVHGAKGLEFPITILSGMTTRPGGNRTGVSVLWDDAGTPEVKLRKGVATANHDPRADLEQEMDEYEKLRLLYVACTRARDHLIVACHHKAGDEKSYAGRIWALSGEGNNTWRRLSGDAVDPPAEVVIAPTLPFVAPAAGDRSDWIDAREALLGPQRRSRFVSATTIAREAGVVAEPAADDDGSEAEVGPDVEEDAARPAVPMRRRGRAGTAIGRAVHATLQLTDFADPAGVDEQSARQAELEVVPDAAETVAAMVRAALESEAVQLAAGAPHHKELYVAAPVGDRVIEGYIDLLVETPDGLVVVDYKTDTVASESDVDAKLAGYELQAAAYAVALEQSTGLRVVDCRFVFCRPKGAIERAVADLSGAKQRVRDHVGSGPHG